DVSNREGLASDDDWYHRCYSPSFASLGLLLKERPNLCVLAEFPAEGSFVEEPMTSSDNDMNLPSLIDSHTSEGSSNSFSPEPSYNSDQSSGNEDNVGSVFALHAEITDDVDYL
ncbi:F-box protein-like, partial [Dorcoceras hygrometricum]